MAIMVKYATMNSHHGVPRLVVWLVVWNKYCKWTTKSCLYHAFLLSPHANACVRSHALVMPIDLSSMSTQWLQVVIKHLKWCGNLSFVVWLFVRLRFTSHYRWWSNRKSNKVVWELFFCCLFGCVSRLSTRGDKTVKWSGRKAITVVIKRPQKSQRASPGEENHDERNKRQRKNMAASRLHFSTSTQRVI